MFRDYSPALLWGHHYIEFGKIPREGLCGLFEHVSMKDSVKLMLTLLPNTENIYALSDFTFTSEQDLQKYLTLISDFPEVTREVLSLSELSYRPLSKKLTPLAPCDLTPLLSVYHDLIGKKKIFEEALLFLKESALSPVSPLWKRGMW